jgi:hypothetical protein
MAKPTSDFVPFSIHVVGEVSGKTWTGDFEVKSRLSKMDQCRADNFFRFYVGDSSPQFASLTVQGIAETLSQLRVRVVKSPAWWTEVGFGEKVEDDLLLAEIYNKAMAAERDYLASLKKQVTSAEADLRSLGTLGEDKAT